MNTKLTVLAALLFAGVSQAALAQEHDHDRWVEPGQRQAPPQHAAPAPRAAPAPQAVPGPQGGPGGPGGRDHRWEGGRGGDRAFQGQPNIAAPQPGPGERDRRWEGGRAFQGQPNVAAPPQAQPGQRADRRFEGDRNRFAPGAPDADRHWDRRDAPREVIPPGQNAERGWDREHDGHGPGRQAWDRRYDERNYARDGRGPPADWRHWERGRMPPVYAASHRYRVGAYRPPYGWYVRNWAYGDILPRAWFGQNYWIDDFWDYDLPYPPPGYHWVRVGDDVLLVDDYSGRIAQVIRDLFW